MIVEITDPEALAAEALDQVGRDTGLAEGERDHTAEAVRDDATEALACLVDPFDLIDDVPGISLAQASWSCAPTAYDPDAEEWDFGEGPGADGEGLAGPDGLPPH
ncbi:hypothetical protein GCM10027168_35370 [Streptomyces capparidis]